MKTVQNTPSGKLKLLLADISITPDCVALDLMCCVTETVLEIWIENNLKQIITGCWQ